MTATRGRKSANSTPKKVAKETPKTTPKKTPVKKPATPTKSTPKKAATPKSTPKKAATPKSTPKKATTPKKVATPKKAATPKKTTEAAPEEATEEAAVTPVTSAPTTPKSKKASAKSTPVKATKKASTSKTSTPVKASKSATPKRKATETTASPAKKAKSGALPEGAIKKPIPSDMIVQDHEAKEWNLYELVQDHGLVIFAYPAASTPGCTKQACFFRDAFTTFSDKGFKVFGLSNDSSKKNAAFYTKQKLNYPLISDPTGKLISFLGIGKDASHKAQRSAFVIPQGGEIMYCNVPASPEPSKDWAKSIVLGL